VSARRATHRAVAMVTVALCLGAWTAPQAGAQALDGLAQRCVRALNQNGAKIAKAQGKQLQLCLKQAAKGVLGASLEQCLHSDTKGKVAKARAKAEAADTKYCAAAPAFGYEGADAVADAAIEQTNAMLIALLGSPLADAAAGPGAAAALVRCQLGVAKVLDKLSQALQRSFLDCKVDGLRDGALASAEDMRDVCLATMVSPTNLRVQKARGKLAQAVISKCLGTSPSLSLATAFPGRCSGAADATALVNCLTDLDDCHACRALADMDGLGADCDVFDDGEVNGSCGQGLPGSTTTTTLSTTTTTTTTTSSTTTTTVDLCDPGPDCGQLDDECRIGVCNPVNGACTLAPRTVGTPCSGEAVATIGNVVLTDLGDVDVLIDGATGDVAEWSHAITKVQDAGAIEVELRAVLGADASTTFDDEQIAATASYRLRFDVQAAGPWRVDIDHSILGAFSIIDEKVALEDAGGSASISPVSATYSVDGSTPVPFGFTPDVTSVTHALGGGEGTTDTEFTGSASTRIHGEGASTVELVFSLALTAFSNSNAALPAAAGDEVAIRLGRSDSISNGFTAGAYPSGNAGLGERVLEDDGHKVAVRLVTFSCPGAGACDGAGACVADPAEDCSTLDEPCVARGVCGVAGCEAEAVVDGDPCDDGDACTDGDSCQAGSCVSGDALDCSGLDNACNTGVCNPGTGACEPDPLPSGTECAPGTPAAAITDPVLVDSSTTDDLLDGSLPTDDLHEWRHSIELVADAGAIDLHLAAVLGAEAGATVGDHGKSATVTLALGFDVTAVGDWELAIDHRLLGAYSILDEKTALEDAGGRAAISVVSASYAIDAGAPVDLSFAPAPTELVHAIGGGEGDSDVEVSGAADALIAGTDSVHIDLAVTFDLVAFSDSNAAFPAAAGDEVALRLGLGDNITNAFTAGAYPSGDANLAARDAAADGYFLALRLTTTTCLPPGTCDGEGSCVDGGAEDCSALDEDCARGVCLPGTSTCATEPLADGLGCDDADLCTTGDQCVAGVCTGTPVDCSGSGDTCNAGICDAGTGACTSEALPDETPCDDSDPCTEADLCVGGECGGTPKDCSGLDDACNTGVCGAGGACEASPVSDGTGCDDGDECTENDQCTAGVCAGTEIVGCRLKLANVTLTDLSTADSKVDGGFDVNEWGHSVAVTDASDTAIDAALKAVIGADACCTVEDENKTATAAWRLEFDVQYLGNWVLDIDHDILGAFTLFDEKVANEDAGGTASITAVSASYSVDAGAPVAFGFTPSPTSRTHALYGGEGNSNVEFAGSASTQIAGSGIVHVVLEFSFGVTAFSNSNAFFPAAGGDEVAVRLGRNDTIGTGFTAGEYPGAGSRDIDLDGHFLRVLASQAP
jgi:hypothetical protein